MTTAAVAQGLLTFAFSDIVGSTLLWERAPADARQALARHNEMLQTEVESRGGTVFKTVGDACCCVFGDPANAVRAALSIQRQMQAQTWPAAVGELRVRIGIHTGYAIAEGGDYFGPTLNRVARLTSAAHGAQILVSATTASATREALALECEMIDLGAHRLKDLMEPQHIYQLVAHGLPSAFPAPLSLDARPNNLPSQLSSFVGRIQELDQLRRLLDDNRLVTVCGVGGIGKTRLALQAAADTIGRYADGSWFVRLADVTDGALIADAIASTLHLTGVPGQPLVKTLKDYLSTRALFLVLDNAEHLVAATAAIVRDVLESSAGVAVLVTSREPLHISGERVLRVGPMEAEDAQALFRDRAELASADAYVDRICDRLDRLPLAMEIAAAHIGVLTTKQLEARLQTMSQSLASKDASEEARHRTLQATVDWSYRLLNPKEQRFFAILGVFEGGFTLEACEAVAWAGEEDDPAFALLDALVDKSFVSAEPAGESMRYRLLETLHRFASDKLQEAGERDFARSVHFEYYKSFVQRWATWQSTDEEREYVSALAADLPNVRAALEWGLAQDDPAAAFEMLLGIAPFWQQRCEVTEGRAWLARACAAGDAHAPLLAKLLRRAATFATIADDYDAARSLTARASELFREAGDTAGMAEALHNLAVIEQRTGSERQALILYREALRLFEQTQHEIGIITALYNLALASKHQGEIDAAKGYLERGMSLCATPQHTDRLATFLTLKAELAMGVRAFEEASQALERALEIKTSLGDRHDRVEVLCNIAVLEIRRADVPAAARVARDALSLARELAVPSLLIGCFEIFSVILQTQDQGNRARKIYAVAKAMRGECGYVFGIVDELAPDLTRFSTVPACADLSDDVVRGAIDDLLGG